MEKKKIKIGILVALSLGLCVGMNFALIPSTGSSDDTTDQDSYSANLDTSGTYGANDLSGTGSNIGIISKAYQTTANTSQAQNWRAVPSTSTYRSETMGMEMPRASFTNDYWNVTSGSVSVTGMRDTNNWIAPTGTADLTPYSDLSQIGWSSTNLNTITDNYYSTDPTKKTETHSDLVTYSTSSVTSPNLGTDSTAWKGTDTARTITLKSWDRSQTYNTESWTKTVSTNSAGTSMSRNWGSRIVTTSTNDTWVGGDTGYPGYAANAEAGSTVLISQASGWTWADDRSTNVVASTCSASEISLTGYSRAVSRLYNSATPAATTYLFYALAKNSWNNYQNYQITCESPFYYDYDGTGPQSATLSVDFSFSDIYRKALTGDNLEGTIIVEIVKPVSGSVVTIRNGYFNDATFDTTTYNSTFDVSSYNIKSYLDETGTYTFRIKIGLNTKVSGSNDLVADTDPSPIGSRKASTLDIAAVEYKTGCKVTATGMSVNIQDECKWGASSTTNNNYDSTSHLMKAYYQTVDALQFQKRVIPAGIYPTLTYQYYISPQIVGVDGAKSGLGYANMAAWLYIVKDSVPKLFNCTDSASFEDVSGSKAYEGGAGCKKFTWQLTSDVISYLNNSDYFYVQIGMYFKQNFELDYNTAGAVYIKDLDFTFTTAPKADRISLKLVYLAENSQTQSWSFVNTADGLGATVSFTVSSSDPVQTYMAFNHNDQFYLTSTVQGMNLNYRFTLNIQLEYWESQTKFYFTNGTNYYEANFTIVNPQPQDSGVNWDSPVIQTAFNDAYNLTLVIPRYQQGTGGEVYWDCISAQDYNYNGIKIWSGYDTYQEYTEANYQGVYVNENPSITYGDSYTTGRVQTVFFSNSLFHFYTSSTSGTESDMDWNVLFSSPSEITTIKLDDVDPVVAHQTSFYSGNLISIKSIYHNSISSYNATSKTIQFQILNNNHNTVSTLGTFIVGSESDLTKDVYTVLDSDILGLNWMGRSFMNISGCCGQTRVSGAKHLSGLYAGGLIYRIFAVRSLTYVRANTIIHSNTELVESNDGTFTNYYNTTAQQGIESNITVQFTWTDVKGDGIAGAESAKIWVYTYPNKGEPEKELYCYPAYKGVSLTDLGNGSYSIELDPMDVYGARGILDRGYHFWNATLSKTNYDSVVTGGNFSIAVDTYLEIITPSHAQYLDRDGYYYHHYDGSRLFAGDEYEFSAQLVENFTGGSTRNVTIANNAYNYYSGAVIMTYQLSNITYVDYPLVEVPMADFINETYFDNLYGTDPTSSTWKNPLYGYMSCSYSSTDFSATISWPSWTDDTYSSGSLSAWDDQKNLQKYVLLHYNVSVYVQTNRTASTTSTDFQPNDVVGQSCAPFTDNSSTLDYIGSVKFKEECFTLRLKQQNTGNLSRIIPTMMNTTVDNNPYAMGTYDADEANIMSFSTTAPWEPTFEIKNYRNNVTAGADEFNIRVMVNCSIMQSAINEFYAGVVNDKTYVLGPLNDTNTMYGVTYSQDWIGNTTLYLAGWNNNGTKIQLVPDYNTLWSTTVNTTGGYPFVAYGCTYVTPTKLKWSDKNVGTYTLRVEGTKEGFSLDDSIIYCSILAAPTKIMNGSKTNPNVVTDEISVAKYIDLYTPTGVDASFVLNFSDYTNYYTTHTLTTPVDSALITCISDYRGYYVNNISMAGNQGSWYWKDLGNGLYNVTIRYTDYEVSGSVDNKTENIMQFRVTRANYQSSDFEVHLNIMKRVLQLQIVSGQYTDYKLPDHDEVGDQFDVSNLKINVTFIDTTLGLNTPVDFSLATLFDTTRLYISGTSTLVNSQITKFGTIYQITISTKDLDIGNINLRYQITSVSNYTDTYVNTAVTVLPNDAAVTVLSTTATTKEFYPLDASESAEIKYLPYCIFKYEDQRYLDSANNPLNYRIFDTEVYSNFTNPTRDGTSAYPYLDENAGNPNLLISTKVYSLANVNYYNNSVYIDASSLSVQSFDVNFTIQKEGYNNVSFVVHFVVTNASTLIYQDKLKYQAADRTSVYDLGTFADGSSSYDSVNSFIPLTLPWKYLIQFIVPYRASAKSYEDLLTDEFGTVYMTVTEHTSSGVTIFHYAGNSLTTMYSYLYLIANTESLDTTYINFTISIWKTNYQPQSYDVNIKVTPRETRLDDLDYLSYSDYRQDSSCTFYYRENYGTHPGILRAQLNISNSIVAADSEGVYFFSEDESALITFEERGSGRYQIYIDTYNLSVGDTYTFSVLIQLPHYDAQIVTYSFTVRPISLQSNLWLTAQSVDRDIDYSADSLTIFSNSTSFNMWVDVYVVFQNELGEDSDPLALIDDIVITVHIYNSYDRDDNNDPKEIRSFVLGYNNQQRSFYQNVSIAGEGLLDEDLSSYNLINIEVNSTNPNYSPTELRGTVQIVDLTGNTVPAWFPYAVMLIVGAAAVMGGYGMKSVLRLRIPYVLRMIDDSIEMIEKDKFPPVGVMQGRAEYVIDKVIEALEMCGIEWEISDKIEAKSDEEGEGEEEERSVGKPMSHDEIVAALNKIETLNPDERALFIDELKRMDRKAQDEFIQSLKEE